MTSEIITITSTLGVAIVAGVISYLAGKGLKTHEWTLTLAKDEISARKLLYSSFLAEAQRLIIQSIEEKLNRVTELNKLQDCYAEITLLGSTDLVEAATRVFDCVLTAHSREENKFGSANFHAIKQLFVQTARTELTSLKHKR